MTLGDLPPGTVWEPVGILIQQTTYEERVLISGKFEYGLDIEWLWGSC